MCESPQVVKVARTCESRKSWSATRPAKHGHGAIVVDDTLQLKAKILKIAILNVGVLLFCNKHENSNYV